MRTASVEVFACYRKACAPPPIGKGGTMKGRAKSAPAAPSKVAPATKKTVPAAKKAAPSKKVSPAVKKMADSVKGTTSDAISGSFGRGPTASVKDRAAALKKLSRSTDNKRVMGILEVNGMNGKPKVVSQAEFDKLPARDRMARTAPKSANSKLVSGDKHELRDGSGNYGEGTYLARGANGARHVKEVYGDTGHTVIEAHVNTKGLLSSGQIGNINDAAHYVLELGRDIDAAMKSRKVPKEHREMVQDLVNVIRESGLRDPEGLGSPVDTGTAAAILGIKAYNVTLVKGDEHDDNYLVLLDRSAMTVSTNPVYNRSDLSDDDWW